MKAYHLWVDHYKEKMYKHYYIKANTLDESKEKIAKFYKDCNLILGEYGDYKTSDVWLCWDSEIKETNNEENDVTLVATEDYYGGETETSFP